jgi:hypothetical protein
MYSWLESQFNVYRNNTNRTIQTRHINIAERIRNKFDIPNCVGIIYGTLLPLETRPLINGEDYFTRKGFYGINGLITCADFG